MIRHDHEGIQPDPGAYPGGIFPRHRYDSAGGIAIHPTIGNSTEQVASILGADGQKVSPRGTIIVFRQANGAAAMSGAIG